MEEIKPSVLEHWPQQSPINIETTYRTDLPPLAFKYPAKVVGTFTPSGHGANFELKASSKASLRFEGQDCRLVKLHFHARSEHRVGGQDYPLEIHLIHEIPKPTSGSKFVVVGVFLEEVARAATPEVFMEFAKFFSAFPKAGKRAADAAPPSGEVEFAPLTCLPDDRSYYRYEGSLTTEPFNEFISWVVLKDKVAVKASDIKPITAHALHEARVPQPLNRRFVLRSFE